MYQEGLLITNSGPALIMKTIMVSRTEPSDLGTLKTLTLSFPC